jgi:F-type H+-transporting ATPase subunit delta
MARGPTARRYAQALFGLAQDQGKEDAWLGQLTEASDALAAPTVALYLSVPRVPMADKLSAVGNLTARADSLLTNAVSLLAERGSLALLPAIVLEYGARLNESQGRAQAQVTTAVALSDTQRDRLGGLLRDMLERDVVIEAAVDPEVIGGVVVQVGDQIIDGSVRARLEALKRQLESERLATGGSTSMEERA